MQIPNLTLAYLIAELSPLVEGSIVRKVQELKNNWLKFKLQTRQGTRDLVIAPSAFFIALHSLPAKQQSSGFGAFLRKRLANKRILSLKQHALDRIVLLEFDSCFLILELFAKGNVVLATKGFEIISAYRREQWRDRAISKGQPYKFPSSKGLNPVEASKSTLKKIFSESRSDCIRTLVSALNIAPVVGEEACLRAGIEKSGPAEKLGESELEKILAQLRQLYAIDPKKIKPGIVAEQLLPFEMHAAGPVESNFTSLNEAISGHFSALFKEKQGTGESRKQLQLGRSLEKQLAAVAGLEGRAAEARARGEAVYANYAALNEALRLARQFVAGKLNKKDVMYKLECLGIKLKQIDLKGRKISIELAK